MNKTKIDTRSLSDWERLVGNKLFKYQALFDSNMLGVAATDFKDRVISANDAFLSMVGYTQDDIRDGSLRWSVISPEKYDKADIEKIDELLQNKRIVPFEKEYVHKDGSLVPVLVGAEVLAEEPTFGVCFAVDVTRFAERNKKKDEFISMVSHELRTPLSVMKFSTETLELLIKSKATTPSLLEATNQLSNQIDKMKMMITDLTNMARYQMSQDDIAMTGIDVHACVHTLVMDLANVTKRSIELQGETAVFVIGNRERFSQVIMNLITNAVRYSADDTDITVVVRSSDDRVYIDVIDRGMGIARENMRKIFDHHYRINHADDYQGVGMGVGLYISNEIIKGHGGQITVESQLGKGSTFTVELTKVM